MKILAIDDNQDNLAVLKAILADNLPDTQVLVAPNGTAGLELARADDPDVILLDIFMPGMDGFAVCKIVKEDTHLQVIPVLFLTDLRTDKTTRRRALEAGVEGFLSIPYDEVELIAQIRVMAKLKAAAVRQQSENERLAGLVTERTAALQKAKVATLNIMEDLKEENAARIKSETQLRESDERFQQLFDHMAEGLAIYQAVDDGQDFVFVDLNRTGQVFNKLRLEDVLGRRITEVFPKIEQMGLLAVLQRVWRTGVSEHLPLTRYVDDRIEDWVENYVYKLPSGLVVAIYSDTSVQRRAEEALRESEQQYRLLADNMSDAIWLMDMNLHTVYISPSVTKRSGYSLDEINSVPLERQMTPDSYQRAMTLFAEALAMEELGRTPPRQIYTIELEYYHKDGSHFWREDTFTPIRDETGRPINILGCGRDITERKKAEESLAKSENQYRMLADNMSDTVWLFDLDINTVYISPSVTKLHGYTLQEIDAVPLERHLTADSIRRLTSLHAVVLSPENLAHPEADRNYTIELEFYRKDGSSFWVESSFALIRDQAGQPINVLCTGRDITERKQAQEALRESEQRFKQLFDNMAEGMAVYQAVDEGLDFIIVDINEPGQRTDKVIKSEVIGRRLTEVYPGIEQMGLLDVLRRVWRSGQPERQPLSLYADGRIEQWVENAVYKLPSGMIATIYEDTSAQHRAEEALRESEHKYRMLAENTSDTIWLFDMNVNTVYISPSVTRLHGYRLDEVDLLTLDQSLSPDSLQKVKALWDYALTPEYLDGPNIDQNYRMELEFRRKDGTYFWSENTFGLVTDDNGKPINIVCSGRDITERKKAEEALKASEARFKTIFNEAPLGIGLIDSVTRQIYSINAMFAKIAGRSMEEMLKIDWVDITHPDDLQEDLDNMAKLNAGLISQYKMEKRYLGPDGTPIWISMTIAPIEHADTERHHHLCMIEDISERKRAEEALRESEEKHRRLFETMSEGVIYRAADGRVLSANPAAEHILRRSLRQMMEGDELLYDKVIRENGSELPAEDRPTSVALRTGKSVLRFVQGLYMSQEDEYVWVSVNAVPIFRPGETKPFQVYATISDITERRQAEEEIRSLARFVSENPDAVMRVARNGVLLYVNPQGLIQLPQWNLQVGQFVPSIVQDVVRECLDSSSTQALDLEHGDQIFSFLAVAVDESGYVNLYGHDVTRRRQAESAMRQQAEEIRARNEELNRFNRVAVGRELRMIELKHEVNELCTQLGRSPIYQILE